jgi:hypothetical protein
MVQWEGQEMEVDGQFHLMVSLFLGETPLVLNDCEAWQAPELVWMMYREKHLFPSLEINYRFLSNPVCTLSLYRLIHLREFPNKTWEVSTNASPHINLVTLWKVRVKYSYEVSEQCCFEIRQCGELALKAQRASAVLSAVVGIDSAHCCSRMGTGTWHATQICLGLPEVSHPLPQSLAI